METKLTVIFDSTAFLFHGFFLIVASELLVSLLKRELNLCFSASSPSCLNPVETEGTYKHCSVPYF